MFVQILSSSAQSLRKFFIAKQLSIIFAKNHWNNLQSILLGWTWCTRKQQYNMRAFWGMWSRFLARRTWRESTMKLRDIYIFFQENVRLFIFVQSLETIEQNLLSNGSYVTSLVALSLCFFIASLILPILSIYVFLKNILFKKV